VQGNIPQQLKWEPEARGYIMEKYFTLTLLAKKDNPGLIVWPEAAVPVVLEEEPFYYERLRGFAKNINAPILFGGVNTSNNLYYNSAILLDSSGDLAGKYDKLHLVPFGEYIPLKDKFPFLETIVPIGDIAPGREYTVFEALHSAGNNFPKFSVLICFEDLFPELSREFVKRGASLLVNITNDAWYKDTSAASQHFQASVFRAVENRVTLVRAANTGISGFITPTGKVTIFVKNNTGKKTFINGYASARIALKEDSLTFYTRHGDVFVLFLFMLTVYGIFRKK